MAITVDDFQEVASCITKDERVYRVITKMAHTAAMGGKIFRENFGKSPKELGVEIKANQTVLTHTDVAVQEAVISDLSQGLRTILADYSFLAEEKRQAPKKNNPQNVIIIDPIDGTKNFASANPTSAIAIAWAKNAHALLSVQATVTLQPELDLYTISSDEAVVQFDRKRKTIKKLDLTQTAPNKVVSLWGEIKNEKDGVVIAEIMRLLGHNGFEVRMVGSCVLTNAGVAAGQYDGGIIYSGEALYAFPWDIASTHQIERAGGVVTSISGMPDPLNSDPHSMIAGRNKDIHETLSFIVNRARTTLGASDIPDRRLIKSYPVLAA